MTEPNTPTELLIERLENIDDVTAAFVLFRKSDGSISYRTAGIDSAELLGMLRYAQLSIESDLVKSWGDA